VLTLKDRWGRIYNKDKLFSQWTFAGGYRGSLVTIDLLLKKPPPTPEAPFVILVDTRVL